jgi:hypothetical protein
MDTDALLKEIISLNQASLVDYDKCLNLAKKLNRNGKDIKHIAHTLQDSKLQILLLGAKKFKQEFNNVYINQSQKDSKILNSELKNLLDDYLKTFDDKLRSKIELIAFQINKVDDINNHRILATCDKHLYLSFFGLCDWTTRFDLFDFYQALLILARNINDNSKVLWRKLFDKMRKHFPKDRYSLKSLEYDSMMDKFAEVGYTDLVDVLHKNDVKLSVYFSNPVYVDWLINNRLDKQLCMHTNLLSQKSLYSNFNLFDWIINSPHFSFPIELSDQDWWNPALSSMNLQSITKLHNLKPLTQKIIDSSKCWEINSVQVLEFLSQNALTVCPKRLFTMNCDVLVFYKNNYSNCNFKELQSTFFIWCAFEHRRTDVLDWFPVDTIYFEFIDFFKSGTTIDEKERFAKTDYIKFAFHYLSKRGFEFQKINDIYEVLLFQPDIELMEFFFEKLGISYHDQMCVAINTRNSDVVRYFHQPNSEWPLEIPCFSFGQSPNKIELFMNSQIIPQYRDFKCHKYRVGYNRNTRKEMIMGVDKFNKWVY